MMKEKNHVVKMDKYEHSVVVQLKTLKIFFWSSGKEAHLIAMSVVSLGVL